MPVEPVAGHLPRVRRGAPETLRALDVGCDPGHRGSPRRGCPNASELLLAAGFRKDARSSRWRCCCILDARSAAWAGVREPEKHGPGGEPGSRRATRSGDAAAPSRGVDSCRGDLMTVGLVARSSFDRHGGRWGPLLCEGASWLGNAEPMAAEMRPPPACSRCTQPPAAEGIKTWQQLARLSVR